MPPKKQVKSKVLVKAKPSAPTAAPPPSPAAPANRGVHPNFLGLPALGALAVRAAPTIWNAAKQAAALAWRHRDKIASAATFAKEHLSKPEIRALEVAERVAHGPIIGPMKTMEWDESLAERRMIAARPDVRVEPGNVINEAPTIHNATFLQQEFIPPDPKNGKSMGVLISGRQILCNIQETNISATTFSAVTGGASATYLGTNNLPLTPAALGGRISKIATNYERYVFRKLTFRYVPRVPTTTSGVLALGLIEDGDYSGAQVPDTFGEVTQLNPGLNVPYYREGTLQYSESKKKLDVEEYYYCRPSTSYGSLSSAELRQFIQARLIGFGDAGSTPTATLRMGFLFVEYVLELRVPTPDLGFTITIPYRAEREIRTAMRKLDFDIRRRLASVNPEASWLYTSQAEFDQAQEEEEKQGAAFELPKPFVSEDSDAESGEENGSDAASVAAPPSVVGGGGAGTRRRT